MTPLHSILPLLMVLVPAAIYDLRYKRIPNLLTLPATVAAILFHSATKGSDGLLFAATGLALGIAVLVLPYLLGVMGGGDVKLLGVVGAFLGPKGAFGTFLLASLIGGGYAIILILLNWNLGKNLILKCTGSLNRLGVTGDFNPDSTHRLESDPKLCYGVAIALGAIIYVFTGQYWPDFFN